MKFYPGEMARWSRHELLVALINPRPIAWVTTVGEDGTPNAAPFSFFMPVGMEPPALAFSLVSRRGGQKKDTLRNIELTGDFVVNVVTPELAERMNITGFDFPPSVSELARAGLTPIPSERVRPPRIAESPASLECRLERIVQVGEEGVGASIIIGQVLVAHVPDELCREGEVDCTQLRLLSRLGGEYYCYPQNIFQMERHREEPDAGGSSA
ncbi:MAG: flavin reductase family protein [Dehalococcoidia bacterium]